MSELFNRASINPTLQIYEPDGRVVDYRQFVQLIDYWRIWLIDRDIGQGSQGILSLDNSASMQALFFACLELGVLFVGADDRAFYALPRLSGIRVDFAITDPANARRINVELPYPVYCPPEQIDLTGIPFDPIVHDPRDPDAMAVMAVTSGTTGDPKIILHSHRTLMASVRRAMQWYQSTDRVAFYMNLNHLGVLSIFTLPVILQGCQIVLSTESIPGQIFDLLTKRGPIDKLLMFEWNWGHLIKMFAEQHVEGQLLGENLPMIITGGKPARTQFIASLLQHGAGSVNVAYGMTQAPPPIITKLVTSTDDYDPTYLGECLPGWEYWVSLKGLIYLKGDAIGFDANGKTLREDFGWMNTGDLGQTVDNRLHIKDRFNQVKRNGETIFLKDIQAATLFVPPNSQTHYSCMTVLPWWDDDLQADPRLLMFVSNLEQMIDGSPLCLHSVNQIIAHSLSRTMQIDHLLVMTKLPDNGLKLDFSKLRQAAATALASGSRPEYYVEID